STAPIFQLNHPWAASELGRDLGFPRAIKMDLRQNLPASDTGKDGLGVWMRTPKNAVHSNHDYDSQEVMNGSLNDTLLQYRAFWFYLLNQGQLRAGTASSDSHSLTDNTVGVPRTVVYPVNGGGSALDRFDIALKNGR